MRNAPAASPSRSPASFFRQQIEAAQVAGVSLESLKLRLTLADVSRLKRDRELAVSDITFGGGVMRFLGVPIQEGGAGVSELVQL